MTTPRQSRADRSDARPPPSSRRSLRRALVVLAVAAGLVAVPAGPAGAAPAISFTQTSPEPARGYYLPDDIISFQIDCSGFAGDSFHLLEGLESAKFGAIGGDGAIASAIPFDIEEGPAEIVVACADLEGNRVFETVVIEMGRTSQLVATVGEVADECATTTEITVAPGTEVYWCYTLTLDVDIDPASPQFVPGITPSARHHVVDTLNGDLGTMVRPLPSSGDPVTSGQLGLVSSSVVTADVTNTGTWDMAMVYDEDLGDLPWAPRQATASVTVQVPGSGGPGPGPGGPAPVGAPAAGPVGGAPSGSGPVAGGRPSPAAAGARPVVGATPFTG